MSSRCLPPRFVFINSSGGACVCRGSQCWALFLYRRCQDHRPVALTYYVMKTLDPIQFFYQCCLRDEDAIIHLLSCVYTHLHQLASTARLGFLKIFPVHSVRSGRSSWMTRWQKCSPWLPFSCPGLLITQQEDHKMCIFNIWRWISEVW